METAPWFHRSLEGQGKGETEKTAQCKAGRWRQLCRQLVQENEVGRPPDREGRSFWGRRDLKGFKAGGTEKGV